MKNLFKGYNKLILGFNTFLPEGEGYKIELTAEEQAEGNAIANGHANNNPTPNITTTPNNTNNSTLETTATTTLPLKTIIARPYVSADSPVPTNTTTTTAVPVTLPSTTTTTAPPVSSGPIINAPLGSIPPSSILPSGNTFAFMGTGKLPPATVNMNTVPGSQVQQAHAIHYVTKIRNRFANEPETYR